ncbi:MAG TPA: hypothetical protein VFE34_16965 [Dongiaceae bacterium]|jgi:hypothetical protein|nr:hypothetical protein [Dongiaceae bacterium]
MARSRDMQQALDIVAGRKPAGPPARAKLGMLERFGVLLWAGVGMMIIALAALYMLS